MNHQGTLDPIHPPCPVCGSPTIGRREPTCSCGWPLPRPFVIPYSTPWSFTPELTQTLKQHEALRLMGKFRGSNHEQIRALHHVRYLYLSRFPQFTVALLADFDRLESLEIDMTGVRDLAGLERLSALRALSLTECRKLEELSALKRASQLVVLDIALCNRVRDLSAVAACSALKWFRFEGKELTNLSFMSGLRSLHTLILTCAIRSGDLSPLVGLPLKRLVLRRRAVQPTALEEFRSSTPSCKIDLV